MVTLALAAAASDVCDDGDRICSMIYDITGKHRLADYSDLIIGKPLAVIGLIALGLLIRWVLFKIVGRVVKRASHGMLPDRLLTSTAVARRAQRAETMGGLFKSVITGLLVAVFGTMILSELGVDIAPIIASAGIIGIALGFGAQSLVKDYLSGVFMILEDQFGVGDVVDLGEASGVVEAVTLRITRVRDVNGAVWYVRNGEILRVGNQSQNWSRTVLDVGVGYGEDLARVRRVLREIAHDVWEEDDFRGRIIEEPEVWGVENLAPDHVVVRVALKTTPGEQWAVAREMRARIKARFDVEGIAFPIPRVVWQQGAGPSTPGATVDPDE